MAEGRKRSAAIDLGGFDEFTRKILEEVFDEKDRPGEGHPDIGNEHGKNVVDQPEIAPKREKRDDDDLLRQHEGIDDYDQQHAACC
ncbi:hypothetical protein ACVIDN_006585 [Rhizobium brockwellii]